MQDKKYKILIIEDDKFFLDLYSKKFIENGYDVMIASDGKEGIETIYKTPDLDLVIIDLLMPNIDGFAVLQKLRDEPRDHKLIKIVLSNLYEDEDINHAFNSGCDDYIIKSSITPDEMITRVKNIIEKFNK